MKCDRCGKELGSEEVRKLRPGLTTLRQLGIKGSTKVLCDRCRRRKK